MARSVYLVRLRPVFQVAHPLGFQPRFSREPVNTREVLSLPHDSLRDTHVTCLPLACVQSTGGLDYLVSHYLHATS